MILNNFRCNSPANSEDSSVEIMWGKIKRAYMFNCVKGVFTARCKNYMRDQLGL